MHGAASAPAPRSRRRGGRCRCQAGHRTGGLAARLAIDDGRRACPTLRSRAKARSLSRRVGRRRKRLSWARSGSAPLAPARRAARWGRAPLTGAPLTGASGTVGSARCARRQAARFRRCPGEGGSADWGGRWPPPAPGSPRRWRWPRRCPLHLAECTAIERIGVVSRLIDQAEDLLGKAGTRAQHDGAPSSRLR